MPFASALLQLVADPSGADRSTAYLLQPSRPVALQLVADPSGADRHDGLPLRPCTCWLQLVADPSGADRWRRSRATPRASCASTGSGSLRSRSVEVRREVLRQLLLQLVADPSGADRGVADGLVFLGTYTSNCERRIDGHSFLTSGSPARVCFSFGYTPLWRASGHGCLHVAQPLARLFLSTKSMHRGME